MNIMDECRDNPFVIAIDGMSASYKSTVAELLRIRLDAGVVHMDDFFLPMHMRSEERLSTPGGNVHYERVKAEIVESFPKGEAFRYRRFDCGVMDYGQEAEVPKSDIYIVEGAYSMHPYLGNYYHMAVFMKVSEKQQLERIYKRNGDVSAFVERWIPMEQSYAKAFGVEEKADIVIDTTDITPEVAAELIAKYINSGSSFN